MKKIMKLFGLFTHCMAISMIARLFTDCMASSLLVNPFILSGIVSIDYRYHAMTMQHLMFIGQRSSSQGTKISQFGLILPFPAVMRCIVT